MSPSHYSVALRVGGDFLLALFACAAATVVSLIVLLEMTKQKQYERSLAGTLRNQALRVVTPEDFVIFKALSTRERDIEDAVTVVRSLRDRLDMPALEAEIVRLASEISDHNVEGRFERILTLARGH